MRILEGLDALADLELDPAAPGIVNRSVVAVGVFDGMHLGHLRLLHELVEFGSELDATPTVITFANHPDEILAGRAPEPILSVPHRLRLLRRAGVQRVLLLRFDAGVQEMRAEEFATRVLRQGLNTVGLMLGFDSAMGKDRAGTPERFRELGFEVRTGKPVQLQHETISSTAIREAIRKGELDRAHRYLGRHATAFGEVVHGDRRGRKLGFPTANVRPECQVLPPQGVYAVEILHEGEQHVGVANLGIRPTFQKGGDDPAPTLEVHFLDCPDLDLYGAVLEVAFVARLRGEQTFASEDALRAQIARDIEAARKVLGAG